MIHAYKNEKGTIDFFKELQSFDLLNDVTDSCLISGMQLDNENSIALECGHTFNYVPLYNDVLTSKTQNGLDIRKLGVNEVRCPYCRHIQKNLLPFKVKMRLKRVHGVNWINVDKCFNDIPNINISLRYDSKCQHLQCCDKIHSILITTDSDINKLKKVYCYEHFKSSYDAYKKTIEQSLCRVRTPSFSNDICDLLSDNIDGILFTEISATNLVISASKCHGTYKSGVNVGKSCTANAKNGSSYCGRHASQCTNVVDGTHNAH